MDLSPSDFAARPFVGGVLGVARPERLARLHASVPGLVTAHHGPDVLLLSGAPLAPYRADGRVSAWAFGYRSPAPTSDWQAAAEAAEAPGLADLGDRVVLHSNALGFIDLYTRQLDDALWFASRMEPLLALDEAPLEVDWETWAAILAFHCPVGDATTFRAVRRLLGARTHILERATGPIRSDRWAPSWQGLPGVDPDAGDPAGVSEQLRDVVRTLEPGPYALALSGGFDSRLVAIAARDAGIDMIIWSTSKDDGRDDPGITRDLADLLGLPLRFVDPTLMPFGTAGQELRDRTEAMLAMHTWMVPLGAALRENGQPVLTDIVGGVLLGGANLTPEICEMPPGPERRLALMAKLQRPPIVGRTVTERAAAWLMPAARDRWLGTVHRHEGDANEVILSMMETRDTRGIAAMPNWLYGPEVRVEAPIARPEMLRAAFSVGMRRKLKGAFSREVLAAGDAALAAVRTTNDPGAVHRRATSHQASPEGLAWLRADIERARSVPDLVPDGLLRFLELGRWAGPPRRERLLRRSQQPRQRAFRTPEMVDTARMSLPVALLGSWIAANRERLASTEPPWRKRRRVRPVRRG